MSGGFLSGTKKRSVEDQTRRTAFWGSVTAIGFITMLHFAIFKSDGLVLADIRDWSFYNVVLGAIAWSSYSGWRFQTIIKLGGALIFFHMWALTFHMAMMGQGSVFSLPILLFTPLWLVLYNTYRALIFYTVVQSAFVYLYTKYFVLEVYGIQREAPNIEAYAITLAVLSATMVTVLAIISYARKKTNERLLKLIDETERLAAEDPLTGLNNRRAFMDRVEAHWQKRHEFVVIFLDLDRFKPLNDQYGHAAGDHVLQVVSERLKSDRQLSSVSRLGGDEFAAIVENPGTDANLLASVQALHAAITNPIEIDQAAVSVGASIGYARAMEDAASVGELLHASDTAMLRCKASGGGVSKFDPALDDLGLMSSAFGEMFRHALQSEQIIPALQPIVDARTERIVGHELLARWVNSGLSRDPTPADFIPIAEKLGLLNEVLRNTLAQAMRHLRFQTGFLAINVSPSQLSATTFLEMLKSVALENQFPLHRIELEITEHIAFRNLDANIETLERARKFGCTISLDDFGSGYSSLSLLDQLPLDKVKLDRSIQSARYKRDVLHATIRFAKELGFSCCVEGIESDEDARIATKLGSDQLQGFWIGEPELIYPNVHFLKNVS